MRGGYAALLPSRGAHAGPRHRPHRRGAALAVGFVALVAWTLFAGPAAAASAQGPCALERTDARHSEGTSTWNADYRRPLGGVDAVLVFLSFPDHRPDVPIPRLAADHFPSTTDFFARASYGRLRLRPHVVDRWFRMPRPSAGYAIHRDWAPAPRDAYLRDALTTVGRTVDFRRYPVIYLVADPDAPGVDSDATKVINFDDPVHAGPAAIHRLVTVFERHPADPNVLAHETNHVFDLPDLYRRPPSGSTLDWDTQVGDWDLMGSQFSLAPDLFAWHRWKYGWLERSQVTCVEHPGSVTRTLAPVETPGGAKLVVVRVDRTTALAVEARAALGNDVHACTQGVLLYRIRSDVATGDGPVDVVDTHPSTGACYGTSIYPPLADAPLGAGESYTYRFAPWPHGSVAVHVIARAPNGGWTVTVTEP
jgi:M6 family metalloprotease-like protein